MQLDLSSLHMKASLRATGLLALSLLTWLSPQAHAAETVVVPAELLQQLTALTQRVQQLEKQVAQQQQQLAEQHHVAPQILASNSNDNLAQRILVIERKQQMMDYEAAEQKKTTPIVMAGNNGFGLKSADGQFEIKLKGLVQADMRTFEEGIKGQHAYMGDSLAQQQAADDATHSAIDNFLLRRVRPTIEGKFNDIYGFRITTEFGSGSTAVNNLTDAYIDANYDPAYKFRVGKFTPGLSLYRLQSSDANKFNELGLESNFLPSRDIGAQLSGDLFHNTLNYSVGLFNGANDGSNGNDDNNTDKEINARLFASPFTNMHNALQGLGFGVGFSSTDARGSFGNTSLTSYKTFGQESFFSYRKDTSATDTVFADGQRTRLTPQFSYYQGPLGLTGEYVQEKQGLTRVFGAANNQQRTDTMDNNGWDITASYLLTGENASYKTVKPAKPFDPANGGWGAWELLFTTGELAIDNKAFHDSKGALNGVDSFARATQSARAAQNYGIGVNWYLNNVLRASLNYSDTAFDWGGGGTASDPKDRPNERVLVGRIQASF